MGGRAVMGAMPSQSARTIVIGNSKGEKMPREYTPGETLTVSLSSDTAADEAQFRAANGFTNEPLQVLGPNMKNLTSCFNGLEANL